MLAPALTLPFSRKRVLLTRRLMIFFALAYLSQGVSCAQFGILSQPIQYFMVNGLQLSAASASSYLALLMIPWVIKPLYGFISDFIPFFGYRRKSYLIAANLVSAIACLVMTATTSLTVIMWALCFAATSMAVATALMVGLAVERGKRDGKVREYFSIQEIGYYASNLLAALGAGLLCNSLAPVPALHAAALICVFPLLLISVAIWLLLDETKSRLDLVKMKESWASLKQATQLPILWFIGAFSWLWNFAPAGGVPLYFFEVHQLNFSQTQIGQLTAWNSVGMIVAAIIYPAITSRMSVKTQLRFAICVLVLSTLGYLLLTNFMSAILLELGRGMAKMVVFLTIYILAARVCPDRIEVSVLAVLVALRNVATDASTFVGGQLFTYAFHNDYYPLVVVAAVIPALSIFLVPFARIEEKNERETKRLL